MLPPSVKQALSDYARMVPKASEVSPKPLSPAAQRIFQRTVSLQILETLPAAPHNPNINQTQPLPRTPLPKPNAVSPTLGERIDINKTASIRFSWEAVPNASSYQVDLYRTSGGTKALVKSWTTPDLSVMFDQFTQVDLGTFSWQVTALPQSSDKESIKSDPAVSDFEIIKAGTLQAPSMKKLPAPQIKTPGEKSSGSSP
jgi:Neuraminidase (sialidase)